MGSGTLGSAIVLTSQVYGFPTGVAGRSGNQTVDLSWNPVPGAASYVVRYSVNNGGPYDVFAGSTPNSNYRATGLNNGTTYYFTVSAIQGGAEGIPSEQFAITPFDTSQSVFCTGSMAEGGQFTPMVAINSSGPASGQASYLGSEQYTGLINPRELDYYGYGNLQNEIIGTRGYLIFDWGGYGSHLTNISGPFTITLGAGWADLSYLERKFHVDAVVGQNDGLFGNPVGSINIGVNDANFHFLTVISPSQFNNGRHFTLRLTSTNNTSASFRVDEDVGFSHVFQFLFKGNVTLVADGASGAGAIVQALFLDNASVRSALSPPTQLKIVTP